MAFSEPDSFKSLSCKTLCSGDIADVPEKALSRLRVRHRCKSEKQEAVSSAKCVDDQRKTSRLEKRDITAADKVIHRKFPAAGRTFYYVVVDDQIISERTYFILSTYISDCSISGENPYRYEA
jgi:hypothetical protein